MKKKLLILFFSCLIGGSAFGQSTQFQVVNAKITQGVSGAIYIQAQLKNIGNTIFSGEVYLQIRVNGDTLEKADVNYFYDSTAISSFNPGATIQDSIYAIILIKDPAFHIGNNIVVIWPTGGSNKTTTFANAQRMGINDTLNYTLSGIAPVLNYDKYARIYPNPFTDWIRIQKLDPSISISQMIVSDVNGKAVITKYGDLDYMDLPNLPKGVYFLNITYTDGNTSRFKLMGL